MSLVEKIRAKFPTLVTDTEAVRGEEAIGVKPEGIKVIAEFLKNDPEFQMDLLMDLFAVDYLYWEEKALRFEVVYNCYSSVYHHRLFVKAALPEKEPKLDSVFSVWPAANWYEREAWDMFGVHFNGHPNLKRILMYEEFKGHALRKDYAYNQRQPLMGPMN